MNESQLLDQTLELLDAQGASKAYDYLQSQLNNLESLSAQIYNFLYCLAALVDKKDEALGWMEEAIIQKGMWYRPEIFGDEDLDSLRRDPRYQHCEEVSGRRFEEALATTSTKCTWNNKCGDELFLALHGNYQNIELSKRDWTPLCKQGRQIEYVQSSELDSYNLYRWEDEGSGPDQLAQVIESIPVHEYKNLTLCGFSAGCNTILRALHERKVNCHRIILQSPWIPTVGQHLDGIVDALLEKNIKVILLCGTLDKDCLDSSKLFASQAKSRGVSIQSFWIEDLAHMFPNNFEDIVTNCL